LARRKLEYGTVPVRESLLLLVDPWANHFPQGKKKMKKKKKQVDGVRTAM